MRYSASSLFRLGTVLFSLSAFGIAFGQNAAKLTSFPHENIEWLDITTPDANVTLPRVLLIGDSITRLYYPQVQAALKDRAAIGRLSTSKCAGDPELLREVDSLLRQYRFDIIHFNNGMHGSEVDLTTYDAGLTALLALIRRDQPNARLVWAATTPVRTKNDLQHLDPVANDRVKQRNERASRTMKAAGVPVEDLFTLMLDQPGDYMPDGIHPNPDGVKREAQRVVATLSALLPPVQGPK